MTRRFPPARPASFQVEGEYRDRGGAAYRVLGRLTISADNAAQIEGRAILTTAGQFFAPTGGSFNGRLDDGTEIELPHARLDHMNIRWGDIGSGWTTRLEALGHVDWISQRAAYEDSLTADLTVWWTLTHSALLWHVAKKFFTFEPEKLSALGLSLDAVQRATPRPNPCTWDLDGIRFEVGYSEEKYPVSDDLTHYPTGATRFVPRASAKLRFTGTAGELLRELDRVQSTLDRLLNCVGFLQSGRVLWYERTEDAEVDNPSPPPSRGAVYRCARLLVGQFPENPHDSRRALENAPRLVSHAPTMVRRFAEGEPFTSAAFDAYLLAGEAHHWPSRLLLLSTALESMKELYLRAQPERGTLSMARWTEVQKSLEGHLKQIWKDEYGDKELRGRIKSKMRELNRPSYRSTLEAMIASWNVELDGLVDPFGFIQLRDVLVHTGQVPNDDYDALAQATLTVEALFERLMAAWLQVPTAGAATLGAP